MAIDKCSKCGAEMTCDISQGKDTCWCYEKPKVLKYNPEYKGCFCEKCLMDEIEAEVQTEEIKK